MKRQRFDYIIDVVNHDEDKWTHPEGVKGLVRVGVPLGIASRWYGIRRTMTPKGLARKLAERRN